MKSPGPLLPESEHSVFISMSLQAPWRYQLGELLLVTRASAGTLFVIPMAQRFMSAAATIENIFLLIISFLLDVIL